MGQAYRHLTGRTMTSGYLEFSGVKYWLSASSEEEGQWHGEANVRVKVGEGFSEKPVRTPDTYPTDIEAMQAAEAQLKAFCTSGALKVFMPEGFH